MTRFVSITKHFSSDLTEFQSPNDDDDDRSDIIEYVIVFEIETNCVLM